MNPFMRPAKLLALAVSEWLLVMPPAVLLLAAALRLVQPREYEPARSSWVIFEWAVAHISHAGAVLLFIASPGVAAFLGSVALSLAWRRNDLLRQDVGAALGGLRRHFAVLFLGTGTLVAGVILAAVVAHLITD